MPPWAISMTMRRSKLSAKAPAAMEKTMMGSVVDACTSATMLCESVSVVIIQPAPTDWTNPPRLETSVASHSSRNVSCLKGASSDGLSDISLSFRSRVSTSSAEGSHSPIRSTIWWLQLECHKVPNVTIRHWDYPMEPEL